MVHWTIKHYGLEKSANPVITLTVGVALDSSKWGVSNKECGNNNRRKSTLWNSLSFFLCCCRILCFCFLFLFCFLPLFCCLWILTDKKKGKRRKSRQMCTMTMEKHVVGQLKAAGTKNATENCYVTQSASTFLESLPYYYGCISREDAEWILVDEGCPDGMYLLRESGTDFVLSLCHHNRFVFNQHSRKKKSGKYKLTTKTESKAH